MNLTVITAAPVTDLIEVASVRSRLGIEGTSEDSLLEEYISEASSYFREAEVFGRELARQEYLETFYPTVVTRELRLSCNPVDPDSVTVELDGEAITDFEVRNAGAGILYRQVGWPRRSCSDEGDGIAITYKGGFLISASTTRAGVVTPWAAAQAYVAGAWVRAVGTPQALRFECTTAGTSHAVTEPTWPTVAGETVTDGTSGLVWTARVAEELPLLLRTYAGIAVRDFRDAATRLAGVTSEEADSFRVTYSATGSTAVGISVELRERLGPLRARYGRC